MYEKILLRKEINRRWAFEKSIADNKPIIIGTRIYESNELDKITLEDVINGGVFELEESET